MSDEDQQLEQELQKYKVRAEQLSQSVTPLLRQLAPKVSQEALEAACKEVVHSIIRYEQSLQITKGETLAERRRDLGRMKNAFQKCLKVIDLGQSPRGALGDLRFAQLHHKGAKLENLRFQLFSAIYAVDTSLEKLRSQPAHRADPDTAELAANLRWTLAKTLGIRPAMKPDFLLATVNERASANYARLLRLALTLAGKKPPDDLQHIMERGRQRLRHEGVATTERIVLPGFPDGVDVLGYGKFDTK